MTAEDILHIVGREKKLFHEDISTHEKEIREIVSKNRFLVLGGAGSIGQAVTKEIFKRNPKKLHVVDISENNLVELVRDIRSSFGYIDGDFRTFALDIGSVEYDAFIKSDGGYDYVLNLSALKHVRSEKDEYTLMRMIDVNIFNTVKTIQQSIDNGAKKYFCVSTDKAANPVNMMGASKRIMELFLMRMGKQLPISTARFANVAFSDGSLLHGFNNRIAKNQPIVAPADVERYFVTPKESGELCLMSCLFGENGDTFFPQENDQFKLIDLKTVAVNYLESQGYTSKECTTEDEARNYINERTDTKSWGCLFPISDTTGEKPFEEFYTENETLDLKRFKEFGIIKNDFNYDDTMLNHFVDRINEMRNNRAWTKEEIVVLFKELLPAFEHEEKESTSIAKCNMAKFQHVIDQVKEMYGKDRDFIPLHEPLFIGNEKEYLNECIDSTFVSYVGKFVGQFEDMVAEYTGSKHAIAVVNGTSALHLALMVAGVKQNDLVVTQALSFAATANGIMYTGAEPYFIDVDRNNLGMSPEALKTFLEDVEMVDGQAIYTPSGQKVGAIVPMHTFGFPCEIEEIVALANEYNIPVVEDSAESLGSSKNGKHTGTYGLLGIYSFNGNKSITCGGGGMIVTDDEELANKAKHLSTQAKIPHKWEYRHDHIGYNYRCPNINAAIGCAQMENLSKYIENKRETAQEYASFFKDLDIEHISEPENCTSNYWLNAVLLPTPEDRELFLEETNANGVMTRPIWVLLHRLEYLKDVKHGNLENSIFIEQHLVNIPSSVRL